MPTLAAKCISAGQIMRSGCHALGDGGKLTFKRCSDCSVESRRFEKVVQLDLSAVFIVMLVFRKNQQLFPNRFLNTFHQARHLLLSAAVVTAFL